MPLPTSPLDHWCSELNHPEYEFGSAGGLMLFCPSCQREVFRKPIPILHFGHTEYCMYCKGIEMIPVRKTNDSNNTDNA